MKSLNEKLDIMSAALDGKQIEFRPSCGSCWETVIDAPSLSWNWEKFDYRIKLEGFGFSQRWHLTFVKHTDGKLRGPCELDARSHDGDTVEFVELTAEVRDKLGWSK